jgi:hypothetical protein
VSKPPILTYLLSRHPLFGGEYYRGLRPAALMARNYGWGTAVARAMGTAEDNDGGRLSFVTPDDVIVTPDIIILRPVDAWRQHWTDQAHENGQLVIADLDDDYWSHQDWLGEVRPNDDHYDEWFWNVDAVITSTKYLRQRILDMGHRSPVVVAPNCYDPWGLQLEPSPGRVVGTRLWLSGRMEGDLELYDELIQPLLEELDLIFLHVGAQDGHRFTDRGWDERRLEQVGSVPIPMLPQAVQNLSIGTICMSDHPYNLAKTETHAAELAAMGIPLVAASNHALYKNVPGQVDLDPRQVRGRVEALLSPFFWRGESQRAKTWARRLALKNEGQHMSTLLSLVDVLYFSREDDIGVITSMFS